SWRAGHARALQPAARGRLPAQRAENLRSGPGAGALLIMNAETKQALYYWMQLTRTFDERMLAHLKQGRGGGRAVSPRGPAALSLGAASALGPDDVVSPMHRDLGAYLLRGFTPREVFAHLLGRENGPSHGRDANLHGMSDLGRGIIGFISHLPHSLPVALGVA